MASDETLRRWEEKGLVRTMVLLPNTLREALRTQSETSEESVNSVSMRYLIQGIEADGRVFSDEEKATIQEELAEIREENSTRQFYDSLAKEALADMARSDTANSNTTNDTETTAN